MFLKPDNVSGKSKNFFKGKSIFLNDMKRGQKKFFFSFNFCFFATNVTIKFDVVTEGFLIVNTDKQAISSGGLYYGFFELAVGLRDQEFGLPKFN